MKSITKTSLLLNRGKASPPWMFSFKMRELNLFDICLFILSTESGMTYLIRKFGNRLNMFDSVTLLSPFIFLEREPAYRKQEFPSAHRF